MAQVHRPVATFLPALERAAVERGATGAVDCEIRRDDAFLKRGGRHCHLERRPRRIASLNGAVAQRTVLVGRQRGPRHPIDARRKRIRIVRRPAREAEHVAVARVEHHRRPIELDRVEPVLDCFLHVVVEGQLQAVALGRRVFFERPDFTADAVDHHAPRAVLAPERRVVHFLDPRLPDDVAALQPVVARHLRVVHLADISEQVRAHGLGIAARRHLLHDDVRQLEPPRRHGGHLGERCIRHDHDRAIRRLSPVTLDDHAHRVFVHAEHAGQHPYRAAEILGVFADDRDAVRVAVLDEHLAVAIEHEPARGAQGKRPLVVVLGHLLELCMLHHLQHPEADRQHREHCDHQVLEHRQPRSQTTTIFDHLNHKSASQPRLRSPSPFDCSGKKLDDLKRHDAGHCVGTRLPQHRDVRSCPELPDVQHYI